MAVKIKTFVLVLNIIVITLLHRPLCLYPLDCLLCFSLCRGTCHFPCFCCFCSGCCCVKLFGSGNQFENLENLKNSVLFLYVPHDYIHVNHYLQKWVISVQPLTKVKKPKFRVTFAFLPFWFVFCIVSLYRHWCKMDENLNFKKVLLTL